MYTFKLYIFVTIADVKQKQGNERSVDEWKKNKYLRDFFADVKFEGADMDKNGRNDWIDEMVEVCLFYYLKMIKLAETAIER